MSGYQVTTPPNFRSTDPTQQLLDKLALLQNTVSVPEHQTDYTSSNGVTYDAAALLGGYIVRTGNNEGSIQDIFPSATEIIDALKQKCTGIANFSGLKNGTSFVCKLWNNTDHDLYYYSQNGVLVGGPTNQIAGSTNGYPGATCIMEFVINDQASLGEGHTDLVWVCLSRCAAEIAID
jgi:hypothetical protein